jgi:hypothetical protein
MKSWFASLLSDGINDCVSSKRVITLAAFVLCAIAFLSELFLNKKVTPQTFDAMMYIVIAGLGFTASEKLVSRKE